MNIDASAKIIWDYMQLHQTVERADAIFVLGSHDTRVAEYAAELYTRGLAPLVIISGGVGRLTDGVFSETEAETFATIMIAKGVPEDVLLLEKNAANTGENIRFAYKLLAERKQHPMSFILVQKPYMERRTFATFVKQWPGEDVKIQVTSPRIAYEDYFRPGMTRDEVINIMVGDLQRIREYPKKGFQIEQEIPADVWRAFEELVDAGYTDQLIKD